MGQQGLQIALLRYLAQIPVGRCSYSAMQTRPQQHLSDRILSWLKLCSQSHQHTKVNLWVASASCIKSAELASHGEIAFVHLGDAVTSAQHQQGADHVRHAFMAVHHNKFKAVTFYSSDCVVLVDRKLKP